MKKKFVVIFAVIAVIGVMFALAACKDGGEETFEGSDDMGREYGQVYALTQESADGWFRVPAESFSESTMGKFMVDNTRKDYVTVIRSGEDYSLIYHATSDDMNNVRLVIDGQDVARKGLAVERDEQPLLSRHRRLDIYHGTVERRRGIGILQFVLFGERYTVVVGRNCALGTRTVKKECRAGYRPEH